MSDNQDNLDNIGTISNFKRREYGTPIDCSDIIKPAQNHPQIYVPGGYQTESGPSGSKTKGSESSNSSTSINDKKFNEKGTKNRRKKRENKTGSKAQTSKMYQSQNPNEILEELTNNLRKILLPIQDDEKQPRNDQKLNKNSNLVKNPFAGKKRNEVRSNESTQKKVVFTNSKFKGESKSNSERNSVENGSLKNRRSLDNSKKDFNNKKPQTPRNDKKSTPNKKKLNRSFVEEEIEFEDYLSQELVQEGLAKGELFKGNIRINPKDYQTAYISNPVKTENDLAIEGLKDRNRALDGDKVVYKIKEEEFWKSPKHKTAKVVHIWEKVHPRTAIGTLKLAADKNKQFAIFHPRDSRVPRIKILFTDWPPLFYDNADKYENVLYLAKIKDWPSSKLANGNLLENIGLAGDIKVETAAILKENQVDTSPYPESFKKYYSKISNIPETEIESRLDLRKECIFTIDPLTARDLDDAVSCKILPNGNFEVGVHISDVGYFLDEDTPLDKIVSARATSTYMVESVYHMLPKELCFACSLLPGEDKLAFSVIWELTEEGKIVNHQFARTIINSCTQLAYEHAQMVIDDPNCQLTKENLPEIHNGYQPEDLKNTIQNLYKISANLRKFRFDTGALRIDQPKLCFEIDPATCTPLSYRIYEQKESHRLIEEFMLLANMSVATFLKNEYPDIAFLRCHPKPNDIMITRLKEFLEKVGILLDTTSAGTFQQSLWAYSGKDELSMGRMLVLSSLCAKTINRAEYFCTGLPKHSEIDDDFDLDDYCWHYALNVPLYTHFTSPIRRYADVMVHRLLAGALNYTPRPNWEINDVAEIATNCNRRKYNAKRAGEQSLELYYIQYVAKMGSLVENGIVCEVRETSFDAILMDSGITVRVFLNTLPSKAVFSILDEDGKEIVLNNGKNKTEKKEFTPDKKIKTLIINWPDRNQKNPPKQQLISMFTIVQLKIYKNDKKLKLDTELLRPK